MTNSSPPANQGPGQQMLRGSAWLIGLRWAIRLTGVVSTIILARLLSPKDFGIVAIAMIVVGLFEMLSWTGQGAAIIRHAAPSREHYDTAWTISGFIGIGIAVALFLVAPLTTIYFHDSRAIAVIQWLALRPLLSGFENVGTVDFQRELRFDRVFGYIFYAKLVSFVLTISLAIVLRSYWALVAGILVGQTARTVLSFVMHRYRPRITLSKRNEIWSFSIWVFVRAIGGYFMSQVDIIAIGGVAGATSMGRYTVAKDVASSPTEELNEPVSAVLFPVMARYQHDQQQLRQLYIRTLGWAAVIGISTSFGASMIATDMVRLFLGNKWIDIDPLIVWLALTAGASALTNSAFTILDIQGLPKLGARMQWARVAMLSFAIIPVAYFSHNLIWIAIARLAMTLLFIPSLLYTAGKRVSVSGKNTISALWRPLVAGGVMAGAIALLNAVVPFYWAARLASDIIVGGIVFTGALLYCWRLSGMPQVSPENDILALIHYGKPYLNTIRGRLLRMGQ